MSLAALVIFLIVILLLFPIFRQVDPQTQQIIWVLIVLLILYLLYDGAGWAHHLGRRVL